MPLSDVYGRSNLVSFAVYSVAETPPLILTEPRDPEVILGTLSLLSALTPSFPILMGFLLLFR